jgi:hypothetical protein
MSQSRALLRNARLLHLYLGVFTAPALLFFAFTGALQTFSLHETTQGSSYKPPAWIASLAQLHKKQTPEVPVRRPKPESAPHGGPGATGESRPAARPKAEPSSAQGNAPNAPAPKPKSHLPMKIFFLIVSVGLFLSTVTGIYMSYRYMRNWLVITALLAAGVMLPLLLLLF